MSVFREAPGFSRGEHVTLILALCAFALAPIAALAHPADNVLPHEQAVAQCAPARAALASLKAHYHETPAWIGFDGDGTSTVLTRAPGGKTWTLLAVGMVSGVSVACIIEAGGAPIADLATQ